MHRSVMAATVLAVGLSGLATPVWGQGAGQGSGQGGGAPAKPEKAPSTPPSPATPPSGEASKGGAPTGDAPRAGAATGGSTDGAPSGAGKAKSLDDVLGIPQAGGRTDGVGDAGPALDKATDRVEKALDEKGLEDLMRQALGGMRVSAERLAGETDVGLGTQRVQQDVIAKLDILIEEAKKRCKGGSCSGSSSASGEQAGAKSGQSKGSPGAGASGSQKSPADLAQKPGESQSRKQGRGPGKPGDGQTATGGEAPRVDGSEAAALLDETAAEWGSLPERVRDLIRQGSRDRMASVYQRLTEEYYRRMAEDASR